MHDSDFQKKPSTELLEQLITAYKDMKRKSLKQAKLTDSYALRVTLIQTAFEYDVTIKQLLKLNSHLKSFSSDEHSATSS